MLTLPAFIMQHMDIRCNLLVAVVTTYMYACSLHMVGVSTCMFTMGWC